MIRFQNASAIAACLVLAACGGGGSGSGVASAPAPIPAPSPSPSPSPAPTATTTTVHEPIASPVTRPGTYDAIAAIQTVRNGDLTASRVGTGGDVKMVIAAVPAGNAQLSYTLQFNAADIPATRSEHLIPDRCLNGTCVPFGWKHVVTQYAADGSVRSISTQTFDGTDSGSENRMPSGDLAAMTFYGTGLSYVTYGIWESDPSHFMDSTLSDGTRIYFVHGDRTSAGEIPTTGTATYNAVLAGITSKTSTGGIVSGLAFTLSADFGNRSIAAQILQDYATYPIDEMSTGAVLGINASGSAPFSASGSFSIPLSGTLTHGVPGPVTSSAAGALDGAFFGPGAVQIGGVFSIGQALGNALVTDVFLRGEELSCMRIVGAAAIVALLQAPPAFADEQPQAIRLEKLSAQDVLAIAGQLVGAGKYDDALVLLDRLDADGAGGPERDFLDGMVALAHKDFPRAEAMFRRILAGDPSLVRVRLELARTLFIQKKDEEADYHFRLAIAEHPPASVVQVVARFREALRARRAWRFNLTFGLAPDSNINSATDKERVDIAGLPFQLDPSARARSGTGIIAGAEASIRLRRNSKVPVYLGAYGRMVRYPDHDFDDIYIGGEAGPEFRLGGGRLRIAATGLQRWYGGRHLVSSTGGRLHFDKVIDGAWAIEAALAVRHNDYSRRSDINGWDIEASLAANRALGRSTLGFAYGSLQRSIARDPGHSNWQGRLGLGVLKEIPWGLRPQVSFEVGRQVNDAPLAPFGRGRRDWRLQAAASIYKRDWNIAGFAPSLSLTWSRNFSTIALYDQRRLRAECGITKAF